MLVVEDNIVNQRVAVALLDKLGVCAEVAAHGLEAITMLESAAYDLVFMDCHMPTMNGYDATMRIREMAGAQGRVPIVAMTADVMDESRQQAARSGMNDFVVKPVDATEFARALRTWLPAAA